MDGVVFPGAPRPSTFFVTEEMCSRDEGIELEFRWRVCNDSEFRYKPGLAHLIRLKGQDVSPRGWRLIIPANKCRTSIQKYTLKNCDEGTTVGAKVIMQGNLAKQGNNFNFFQRCILRSQATVRIINGPSQPPGQDDECDVTTGRIGAITLNQLDQDFNEIFLLFPQECVGKKTNKDIVLGFWKDGKQLEKDNYSPILLFSGFLIEQDANGNGILNFSNPGTDKTFLTNINIGAKVAMVTNGQDYVIDIFHMNKPNNEGNDGPVLTCSQKCVASGL